MGAVKRTPWKCSFVHLLGQIILILNHFLIAAAREVNKFPRYFLKGQTTATFTQWIGGNESKRQLHSSPPSRPIQSWPVVVPK